MWTREELKERAKKAFRRNYWKCVLVALIITVITGSGSNAGSDSEDSSYTDVNHSVTEFVENEFMDWEDSSSGISGAVGTAVDNASRLIADEISPIAVWRLLTGTVFGVFFLLIALAGIFMQIFVLNVAEVGGSRFFLWGNLNLVGPMFMAGWPERRNLFRDVVLYSSDARRFTLELKGEEGRNVWKEILR